MRIRGCFLSCKRGRKKAFCHCRFGGKAAFSRTMRKARKLAVKPLAKLQMDVLFELFRDYATIGGMPEVVNTYIKNKNFSGTLGIQKQLLKDYEEDITKYVDGLDKAKVKAVYNHISTFLAKENN